MIVQFKTIKKIALLFIFLILVQVISPILLGVKYAHASNDPCGTSGLPVPDYYGGVTLDKAATFLADMTDITGSYYDQSKNVIVFIGKKDLTLPQFDKDDLAVAIKSIIFNNTNPSVSIDFKDLNNITAYENMNVNFYGGIENTNFGNVLFRADYELKKYMVGYNENGQEIISNVPGYQSVLRRFINNGPDISKRSASRWWISPKIVSLKKDQANNSFVFDQVIMQVETAPLISGNDPAWDKAAYDFANNQTQYFDQYAVENQWYSKIKQLSKITSVIKWLKDNQINTDYTWANEYKPIFVPTPTEVKRITSPNIISGQYYYSMTGGIIYSTPNSYSTDTGGQSVILKNASQASAQSSADGITWNFTSGGQSYQSVSVSADILKSSGAFNTTYNDSSLTSVNKIPISLSRTYSSFLTNTDEGFGPGWSLNQPSLNDILPTYKIYCSATGGYTGIYPYKIAINTPSYGRETFTFSCSSGYIADSPVYHSKVSRLASGAFLVKTKDSTTYEFSSATTTTNNINNSRYIISTTTDTNGNTITNGWNLNNDRIITITDNVSGNKINLQYSTSTNPKILAVSSPSGTTTYSYNPLGELEKVIYPKSNTVRYEYNPGHLLNKIKNDNNQDVVVNTYDLKNRLTSQQDINGVVKTYSYNDNDNSISWQDNFGRNGKSFFNDKVQLIKTVDVNNASSTYEYGTTTNSPTSFINALGLKTTYSYDSKGNPTLIVQPDGRKIEYNFDSNNNLTKVIDYGYSTTSPRITEYSYDNKNNRAQLKIAGQIISKNSYDSYGNISSTTNALNNTIEYNYNNLGEPINIKDSIGNIQKNYYDNSGKLIKSEYPSGAFLSYQYDGNGNRISIANPLGTSSIEYDNLNRPSTTTDENGYKTVIKYNSEGNISGIVDSTGTSTGYLYDKYNNLTKIIDSKQKETNLSYNNIDKLKTYKTPEGKQWSYDYDLAGNRINIGKPKNNNQTIVYNSLQKISTNKIGNNIYKYIYDGAGRLTNVANQNGTTTYSYDIYDRVSSITDQNNATVQYVYDLANNLTSTIYPGNKTVNYTYYPNNSLKEQIDWNNSTTTYIYTDDNLLKNKILPNGITQTNQYDSSNRLNSINFSSASNTSIYKIQYDRDSKGYVNKITESDSSSTTPKIYQYSYDPLGRVVSASSSDSLYQYSYDSNGNILSSISNNLVFNGDYSTSTVTLLKDLSTTTILSSIIGTSSTIYTSVKTETWSASPLATGTPYLADYRFNGELGTLNKKVDSMNSTQFLSENNVTSAPGQIILSRAYNFNGNGYLTLPTKYAPGTGSTTLSAWIKVSTGAEGNILGSSNSDGSYIKLGLKNNSIIAELSYVNGSTTNYFSASTSKKNIWDNNWHKIDISFSNSSGGIYVYVDGVLLLKTASAIFNIPSVDNGWTVGAMKQPNGAIDSFFTGIIDEIGITDRGFNSANLVKVRFDAESTSTPVIDQMVYGKSTSTSVTRISPYSSTTQSVIYSSKTSSSSSPMGSNVVTGMYSFSTTTEIVARPIGYLSSGYLSMLYSTSTINGTTTQNISTTTSTQYVDDVIYTPIKTSVRIEKNYSYGDDNELLNVVKNISGSISSTTITYDSNGNMNTVVSDSSSGSNKFMVFNDVDLLGTYISPTSTISLTYDSQGNRLSKVNGFSTVNYINDLLAPNTKVLVESNASNTSKNINVWGITGLLSTGQSSSADRIYPLTDGLGTTKILTDSKGNIVSKYEYDPYGGISSSIGSVKNAYTFTSESYDQDSGLYYLRARYYDPDLGRFISRDSEMGDVSNPSTQNAYIYALNNPLSYTDPSGRWFQEYLSGQQSWDDFSTEVGQATLTLTGDSAYWDFIISHPCLSGAAIGIGAGSIAYGASLAFTAIFDAGETTGLGSQNPIVRDAARYGQEIHKLYKAEIANQETLIKEYRYIKGIRPDFVDKINKIIYELKPDNPEAIAKGLKQLSRYQQIFLEKTGELYEIILETYGRK